jgi:hypothetical protein
LIRELKAENDRLKKELADLMAKSGQGVPITQVEADLQRNEQKLAKMENWEGMV